MVDASTVNDQLISLNFLNQFNKSVAKSWEFNSVVLHYTVTNELAKPKPAYVEKENK